jgi:hypothetical protein
MLNQNPLLSRLSKTAEEYQSDTRKLLGMGAPEYLRPAESEKVASFSPDLLSMSDSELLAKMAEDPALAELIVACRDFAIVDTDCKVAAQTGDPDLIGYTEACKDAFLKTAAETGLAPAPPGAPSQNLRTNGVVDPTKPTTTTTKGDLLGTFLK